MRIGMVLDRPFPPDDRVEKEALSLIHAGFEVHLLCFRFGKEAKNETYKGIKINRVFMPRPLFKKLSALILLLPFYNWFWKKKINWFIANKKIEALHIHDLPLVGVGLKVKEKYGIPLVADMHENYPVFISEIKFANTFWGRLLIRKRKWFLKEAQWLSRAERILVVAEGMKRRLQNILMNDSKFVVVQNLPLGGEILNNQKALPEIEQKFKGKFVLFYFGGFDSRRGLDTLLEAAGRVREDIHHLKIVLVGQGSFQVALEQMAIRHNIRDIVSFEGWQPTTHLQSYLKNVDICIIPHLKSEQTDNSSPNKLFLYMLFSKPVITSNCNSIQEIVEENRCGMVYESGNSKELADKILYFYKNRERAELMGKNGLQAVREKYDWEIGVQGMIEMYRELQA